MKQNLLVNESDFIMTYPQRQINFYEDFKKVEDMIAKGIGTTEIHKLTGVSKYRISNWRRKAKRVPVTYVSLSEANRRGYFSIGNRSEKAELLAYVTGCCMGDGNISRCLCKTLFTGKNDFLEKLAKIIESNFNANTVLYNYEKMYALDTVFTRFLVAIGSPVGDKTDQKFSVPSWILNGNQYIKIKFLQGLFDSELEIPDFVKNRKNSIRAMHFYHIKTAELVEDGKNFLKQIIFLLNQFDIETGKIYVGRSYIRKRDGKTGVSLYFYIHGRKENFIKFCKVGFFLNSERSKRTLEIMTKIQN